MNEPGIEAFEPSIKRLAELLFLLVESKLPDNDPTLDEGETNDDQDRVQEDIIEADAVNSNLDE